MKKNVLRVVLILGIMVGLGYWVVVSRQNKAQLISIGDRQFRAEIVGTSQKMELGLGNRDILCEQCAMLFVFSEKAPHPFWMKGMRFPLDILWFDSADGRIIHIEKNIPADSQKTYASPEKVDRVLEINAGLAERYGIKKGDTVKLAD